MIDARPVERVKVGCCGFPRGMKDYFNQFKLVEVQQTFYKPPRLETALRWRTEAPPDFEFTLKAWQLITHPASSPTYRKAGLKILPGSEDNYGFFRTSDEVRAAWEETMRIAQALRAKIIVFQCPSSFKEKDENIKQMKKFFKQIRQSGFLFVWEPRADWKEETIGALCQELNLIHCVDPMEKESVYGEPPYFRLHGRPRYQHRFSEAELKSLKNKLENKEMYILFNNINMYNDALAFSRLIRE